jgi:DNA polymerase III gamma/tau subunit
MPLQNQYRPKTFDEVFGNKSTIASLRAIYARESDWPHAVLLQGPKGCGKTTIARIIARKYLECGNDFIEVNSSNNRGIDTARAILDGARYRPFSGKNRVYLLDEVHMTTPEFQNAMLKPLEDSPPYSYFILCTTDPPKLIEALRSRCHTFEVEYLREEETMALIKSVIKKEETEVPEAIVKKIAEASDGCPRDALKILDQVIDLKPEEMEDAIRSFDFGEKQVLDLYRALERGDSWKRITGILSQMDLSNPEGARRAMIGLAAANVMRGQGTLQADFIYDAFKDPIYATGKAGFIFATYRSFVDLDEMSKKSK